jgi:cytochrome P450
LSGAETRLDPAIRNDPFPFYRALRRERPVYYDPGLDVWLVTRYDDAVAVLGDPGTWSLEHGYQDRYANGFVDELAEIMERDGGGFVRDIIACDPPSHTRLRRLIEKAFTAHRVKDLEPRFRKIAKDLAESLAKAGNGDGMRDFAVPFTARVICEQLGFDYAEVGADKISRWTNALLAQIGRMQTRDEMLANAATMCELQNYVIAQIRAREAAPREDMTTDLVHARLDDAENPRLTFAEQVSCVRAFLIAGNDTTAAAITNVLMVLATSPGLLDEIHGKLDDDRAMTRFVEEVLRLLPPVHGLFRTAMKDVELGGAKIPAFSQVCILYASANDDETRFPDGRRLDPGRTNLINHLSFGSGIHRCIGAALARMEIKVATQEIVRALGEIRLTIPTDELTYLPTLATQTLARLPMAVVPRK